MTRERANWLRIAGGAALMSAAAIAGGQVLAQAGLPPEGDWVADALARVCLVVAVFAFIGSYVGLPWPRGPQRRGITDAGREDHVAAMRALLLAAAATPRSGTRETSVRPEPPAPPPAGPPM